MKYLHELLRGPPARSDNLLFLSSQPPLCTCCFPIFFGYPIPGLVSTSLNHIYSARDGLSKRVCRECCMCGNQCIVQIQYHGHLGFNLHANSPPEPLRTTITVSR